MSGPTMGQTVHYTLSAGDVEVIDRTIPMVDADHRQVRNAVHEGDVFPAKVIRVWSTESGCSNLQVFLDGGVCPYWATSRAEGDEPGRWFWPPRV
jgi:hypothetical protein